MTATQIPTASQLLSLGWAISRKTGEPLNLHTRAMLWDQLTWAHRTALRARYGFDENGELTVSAQQLQQQERVRNAVARSATQADGMAMPGGTFPGVGERLRPLLESERTALFAVDHDRWGLHHRGPDGSLIYTSREFWGPLNEGYPEVQLEDTAEWDQLIFGTPEAPCWTCPECNQDLL